MSKIDDLLAKMCPDGVPMIAIKNYLTRQSGMNITAGRMREIAVPNGPVRKIGRAHV